MQSKEELIGYAKAYGTKAARCLHRNHDVAAHRIQTKYHQYLVQQNPAIAAELRDAFNEAYREESSYYIGR